MGIVPGNDALKKRRVSRHSVGDYLVKVTTVAKSDDHGPHVRCEVYEIDSPQLARHADPAAPYVHEDEEPVAVVRLPYELRDDHKHAARLAVPDTPEAPYSTDTADPADLYWQRTRSGLLHERPSGPAWMHEE